MVYSTSCMPTPTATASGGMRSCRSPMWPGALQARTYPSLGNRPADSPATISMKYLTSVTHNDALVTHLRQTKSFACL